MYIYIEKAGHFQILAYSPGLENHLVTTLRQKPALLGTA